MSWLKWNNSEIQNKEISQNVEDNLININWLKDLEISASYDGYNLVEQVEIIAPRITDVNFLFFYTSDNKFLTVQ